MKKHKTSISSSPDLPFDQVLDIFNRTGNIFMSSKPVRIISVDPGNLVSGFCMLENGNISFAANLPNQFVYPKIREFSQRSAYSIVIEDVRPYGSRLTQQLLDTTKFIGELQWRLIDRIAPPTMIPRSVVKKWVFENFQSTILAPVNEKIRKSGKVNDDGECRKPSFHWIDDRLVIKAMKKLWDIPTPKPGKTNQFGIKAHSWQALALASYFLYKSPDMEIPGLHI